eukprot:6443762-Amphidinium_carterae.3
MKSLSITTSPGMHEQEICSIISTQAIQDCSYTWQHLRLSQCTSLHSLLRSSHDQVRDVADLV